MIHHDVIIRPVTTEKTTIQKDASNKFTFEIDRRANRIQVRQAVENIFGVRVSAVKTMHIRGKFKRRGRILGKRKDWKKAIVTLMPGERIEFFEGV